MLDRRPAFGLCIGLMLCLSVWQLLQQNYLLIEDERFFNVTESDENEKYIQQNQLIVPTILINAKTDEHTLIDLNDFDYQINQPKCTNQTSNERSPFVLMLIHSAPKNRKKRNTIRETWGQSDSRVRMFFTIGDTNDTDIQRGIQEENSEFGDIIQGNFLDTYRNLTYKHVMDLKWFTYNCPNLKYLVKMDDDVFVNTPLLYDYLNDLDNPKDFIFCYKFDRARIKRSYRSKWRVSPKELQGRFYPPYCPGFAVIYSGDVVIKLYHVAQHSEYFWIDDVHITGTLAQKLNVNITPLGKTFLTARKLNKLLANEININDLDDFIFVAPNIGDNSIRTLWKLVLIKK